MGKSIILDVNKVLDIYDSACINCPKCGRKMIPLDWEDYCSFCKISIPRDYSNSEQLKNCQKSEQ